MTDARDAGDPAELEAAIRRRHAAIRGRIEAAGGDLDAITVVAVTKGFGIDVLRAALAVGLVDIGENFAQELVGKAEALAAEAEADAARARPRYHFVGQLQRNKVRRLAPIVHLFQTVDRPALGREIAVRAPGGRVLVQVNLTDDPGRGGCSPADAPALVDELRRLDLDVRGLMAVAPLGPLDAARRGFRLVRDLADRLELAERSYGMTADLEAAVAEGATMVRLGTALFGDRPGRAGQRTPVGPADVEH
jgi:PLP dependent protein